MTDSYQVVFQAQTFFRNVYVNIAVDDIKVSPAALCLANPAATTLAPAAPATTAAPPSAYDCDFESGTCQWTIDTSTGNNAALQFLECNYLNWINSVIQYND